MKHIHFYKDMSELTFIENWYATHNDTIEAVKNSEEIINTTSISTLDFAWLLDLGYTIFLHENNRCAVCREGKTELTDKEIRKAHDIRRIWIGGGFDGFFYKHS